MKQFLKKAIDYLLRRQPKNPKLFYDKTALEAIAGNTPFKECSTMKALPFVGDEHCAFKLVEYPPCSPVAVKKMGKQLQAVYNIMKDGRQRSLWRISERLRVSKRSIAARLRDLRKPQYGSHTVEYTYADGRHWYQLILPKVP